MKRINHCLIALAIVTSLPTHSFSAISGYKPGLISASCALISGVTAAWAHRTVKKLEALSDSEKNKPEMRKALGRWKMVNKVCGGICGAFTICSVVLFKKSIQRQNRERRNLEIFREMREENNHARENNQQQISPEARRRAREKIEQQNRVIKQREQEQAREISRNRDVEQIQTQEAVINSIKPHLMQAAQNGNLPEIENLIDQCPGEARANLLNARDEQGNTAWYYALQNKDQEIVEYALEQAARIANFECGICREKKYDPLQYAVGSQTFNCLHFYCFPCLEYTRNGYVQETDFEGQIQRDIKIIRPFDKICPTCKRT